MKGPLLIPVLVVLGACSGTAKQDPTQPPPTPPSQPGPTPTTPAPSGPTTGSTSPTYAPTTAPTTCPALQIKAPDVVSAGRSGRVTLIVTDPGGTPTYKWSVNGGSIESGQGTTSISVAAGNASGTSITATVELGNLPDVCTSRTASATFLVGS